MPPPSSLRKRDPAQASLDMELPIIAGGSKQRPLKCNFGDLSFPDFSFRLPPHIFKLHNLGTWEGENKKKLGNNRVQSDDE